MCYGMNLQKLALVVFGGILVSAPTLWRSISSNRTPIKRNQTKPNRNRQRKIARNPMLRLAADSASANGPAQIVVPAQERICRSWFTAGSPRNAQPGQPVYMETTFPVVVNDRIVIPVGSYVQGEITEAKRAPKGKGGAEIRIHLTTLILPNGYTVKFDATPTNADTGGGEYASKEGQINKDRDKGEDAGTVIKTTGAGAGIGAIAGGGEGAGVGAGIGAAVGLAGVLMTRGPEVQLPRGSSVDIMLDRPLYLDPTKINFTEPGRATALPGPANRPPPARSFPF